MLKFKKPTNLNGTQLIAELAAAGLIVDKICDFGDNAISFETDNQDLAKEIVESHNGVTNVIDLSVAEKLASVGLNLEDLKEALNIG